MSFDEMKNWLPLFLMGGLTLALASQLTREFNPLNIAWLVVTAVGTVVYWLVKVRKPKTDETPEDEAEDESTTPP